MTDHQGRVSLTAKAGRTEPKQSPRDGYFVGTMERSDNVWSRITDWTFDLTTSLAAVEPEFKVRTCWADLAQPFIDAHHAGTLVQVPEKIPEKLFVEDCRNPDA